MLISNFFRFDTYPKFGPAVTKNLTSGLVGKQLQVTVRQLMAFVFVNRCSVKNTFKGILIEA